MRRLNRRIFLFDLMDFAINAGSEGVTDLANVILCLKLQLSFALGLFQLILKMQAGFALAGFFIEDALFLENLVRCLLYTSIPDALRRELLKDAFHGSIPIQPVISVVGADRRLKMCIRDSLCLTRDCTFQSNVRVF